MEKQAGLKVLVVDDEPLIREVLTRYLGRFGHQVTAVETVEDAETAIQERSFNAVLLDDHLPGRMGLQALPDMLARSQAWIAVMSGLSQEETRQDALLLGAKAFFPKPLDLEEIATTLSNITPA